MEKRSRRFLNMIKKFMNDRCIYISASCCFYCITCAVPFVLLLVTAIRYFPVNITDLTRFIYEYVPYDLAVVINTIIDTSKDGNRVVVTLIFALIIIYSSAQVFMTIMDQLNCIYGYEVKKSWIRRRLKAMGSSVIFMAFIIFILLAYVYGPGISDVINERFPNAANILRSMSFKKTIIMPIIFIIAFAVAYHILPSERGHFLRELPGAVISAAGWMFFTEVFYFIVGRIDNFNLLYGGLSNVIVAIFWLYFGFMIFFLGAEVNTYIDKRWIKVPKQVENLRNLKSKGRGVSGVKKVYNDETKKEYEEDK